MVSLEGDPKCLIISRRGRLPVVRRSTDIDYFVNYGNFDFSVSLRRLWKIKTIVNTRFFSSFPRLMHHSCVQILSHSPPSNNRRKMGCSKNSENADPLPNFTLCLTQFSPIPLVGCAHPVTIRSTHTHKHTHSKKGVNYKGGTAGKNVFPRPFIALANQSSSKIVRNQTVCFVFYCFFLFRAKSCCYYRVLLMD